MIRFACPECEKMLRADDSKAGTAIKCPGCSHRFVAPKEEEPEEDFEIVEEEEAPKKKTKPVAAKAAPTKTAPPKKKRHLDEDPPDDGDEEDDDDRPRKNGKGRRSDGGLIDSLPMSYDTQVNIGVLIGLGFHAGAVAAKEPMMKIALAAIGAIFMIWGCMAYAKKKGQSEAYGVLGLVGLLGFIILISLPDKTASRRKKPLKKSKKRV